MAKGFYKELEKNNLALDKKGKNIEEVSRKNAVIYRMKWNLKLWPSVRQMRTLQPRSAWFMDWAQTRKYCGIWTSLVQIMECLLFSSKPFSEPIINYCQLDPSDQTQWFPNQNIKFCIKKCIQKCHQQDVVYFFMPKCAKEKLFCKRWKAPFKRNQWCLNPKKASFKKMHLKMSSAKFIPFSSGLNVLSHTRKKTLN